MAVGTERNARNERNGRVAGRSIQRQTEFDPTLDE